jgi:hypothetical protein
MIRIHLAILAGATLAIGTPALAQCGGGAGGQTGTGATGTTAGLLGTTGGIGGTSRLLTGQGSFAYDMMVSQVIAQQLAQRQMMLAAHQQQIKKEKLAARQYRADQTRAQVAESRARTRAALAAQSGLKPQTSPSQALAYQPVGR